MTALLTCTNCKAENREDGRFCYRCGAKLLQESIDAEFEGRLYEKIEAKLKDKWLARDVVEKDIALKAATNLAEWLKLIAIPLGLAAALMISVLAYFGIKSISDLATVEARAKNLQATADKLVADYKPLQDILPTLTKTVSDVTDLQSRVKGVEKAVAKFGGSVHLKPDIEADLDSTLQRYIQYLKTYGLSGSSAAKVDIEDDISKQRCYHACASGDRILLKNGYAVPALVVHEYTHLVIYHQYSTDPKQWQLSAIEAGVANYLTADFLNSPIIDETDLDVGLPFSNIPHTFDGGQTQGGMAWGAILWHVRSQVPNKDTLTKAIIKSWLGIKITDPPRDYQADFLNGLAANGVNLLLLRTTFNDMSR